jgi:hypothetical protein
VKDIKVLQDTMSVSVKDPANAVRYKKEALSEEEEGMDAQVILCVMVCLSAYMVNSKLLAWGCLFFFVSTAANTYKWSSLRQLLSAGLFTCMGLYMRYFQPGRGLSKF